MKELSIEEKAKRYDEAIKRLEDIDAGKCQKTFVFTEGLFDYIFPELAESEDERIRKEMIFYFQEEILQCSIQEHADKMKKFIAWLEKQGEHKNFLNKIQIGDKVTRNKDGVLVNLSQLKRVAKPADKVESKFHEGDWVVVDGVTQQVTQIWPDGFETDRAWNGKLTFKDVHLWTIQDAKAGDVLCNYHEEYDNPLIFILKKFERVDFGLVKPSDYSSYCFLTAGDRQIFKEGTYHHEHNIKPATKEQRDLLFQKMHEAGYEWNAEKKELKKILQEYPLTPDECIKLTWSKEDEVKINRIVACLENLNVADNDILLKDINWLKSLKPQSQWKPSEEQMKALRFVKKAKILDPEERESLNSLYIHLKKLK